MVYGIMVGVFFGLLGLAFGSFLNVCIHRLPRRIVWLDARDQLLPATDSEYRDTHLARVNEQLRWFSIWRPRSACPECRNQIAWYDNVPVVSWLVLRGRCRHCQAPISPRYMAVEIITGLLFVSAYAAFDATWLAVKFCAFSFFLVGLIFTDAEWKLLPDALTLPGLAVGLVSSLVAPMQDLGLRFMIPALRTEAFRTDGPFSMTYVGTGPWRLASFLQSAGGALAGAAFVYGAGVLYMRMRPDLRERGEGAMGLGDVKLMAMIGSFLGLTLAGLTMFAACLGGSAFGLGMVTRVWLKRRHRGHGRHIPAGRARQSAMLAFRHFQVPFGVFLGAAAIAAIYWGNNAVVWYARFFRLER
ncbi:MAG: prepilin peptidase [Acidobacteria bacterium]|nr:prepilin peptidase [Acidobacteriota bacterium]